MSSFFLPNWSPPDDPARPLPAEGRPWPSDDDDDDDDDDDVLVNLNLQCALAVIECQVGQDYDDDDCNVDFDHHDRHDNQVQQQVEREGFPCSCGPQCENPEGRREFDETEVGGWWL